VALVDLLVLKVKTAKAVDLQRMEYLMAVVEKKEIVKSELLLLILKIIFLRVLVVK
jgi:hypothetical protein